MVLKKTIAMSTAALAATSTPRDDERGATV
jgi:hypothetical protein